MDHNWGTLRSSATATESLVATGPVQSGPSFFLVLWTGLSNTRLRLFLKGYAHKSHPLNNLTKKGVEFVWTAQCQHAFNALKSLTTSYPTLAQPDLDKPLKVEVDASNFATGAALIQHNEWNKPRPIAYRSQTLNQAKRSYNIYNKELLAIMWALQHWRHYLQDAKHQVIVHTDHEALLGFKEPKNIN
jgi:hypothetical protein